MATAVGSRGDSYDNALAFYRRGPWRGREDLELATLECVDWFNNRTLFGTLGYVPPVEYGASWSPDPPHPGRDSMICASINPGAVQLRY